MYLLGYSIDNLSLMALTISTGFVVDDAIVVIENISRYLEQGLSAYEAALRGSREIGFTVLSMSTSLIAVFIPILLMGGIVGRIFREFAVTLSVAVAFSMIISLTTTPAMCAKFLKAEKDRKHNWLDRASEQRIQTALRRICEQSPLGVAAPAAGAGHDAGHGLPGDLSLRRDSQRLLPAAGHRPHQWQRPGQRGHLFSNHAAEAKGLHGDSSGPIRPSRLYRALSIERIPPTSASR